MTDPTAFHPLIDEATAGAGRIIARNISNRGIAASIEGYPHVWARDSMITFLGAALGCEPTAIASMRTSLETLATHQDRFGQIPYLVALADGNASFGSADANVWWVIGAAHYVQLTNDRAWLDSRAKTIIQALDWCEAQDLDHSGLMRTGECMDWADLIANHGQVLFPNVLYAHALKVGASLLQDRDPKIHQRLTQRRDIVLTSLRERFWVADPKTVRDDSHTQVCRKMAVTLRKRPFFLPWVDGFDAGDYMDVTGNLLAVVTSVASAEQADLILSHIDRVGVNRPYPVRVLHPPILPGEQDWRDYYKVFNLNLPDQYHNGGIWPWVGGLYVAALVKAGRRDRAREELNRLAQAIRLGTEPWECNEWLHGQTGQPMGARYQAWSAGMFLYARHAVSTGQLPGLS